MCHLKQTVGVAIEDWKKHVDGKMSRISHTFIIKSHLLLDHVRTMILQNKNVSGSELPRITFASYFRYALMYCNEFQCIWRDKLGNYNFHCNIEAVTYTLSQGGESSTWYEKSSNDLQGSASSLVLETLPGPLAWNFVYPSSIQAL